MDSDKHQFERSEQQRLEGPDRTLAKMFELFFRPEIERRQSAGTLSTNFFLYFAQVLFPPSGQPRILLNEEVTGDGVLRAPRHLTKGEAIQVSDLQFIEKFELPDDLLDNGHFTIVRAGEGWRMFFNFLSGRAKAADMLSLASQFLDAASASAAKGHEGPSVDNLFSAAELVSKAELILYRIKAVTSKKHGAIASAINAWAKLGNMDLAFVDLFNKLGRQRPNARYGDATHRPPVPDHEAFELVRAMIDRGRARVARVTER